MATLTTALTEAYVSAPPSLVILLAVKIEDLR